MFMKPFPKGLGRKFLVFLLNLCLPFALLSCGGGGGGSSTTAGGSSSVSQTKTYVGAASQGDFATFTFNGTHLTYSLSGTVFGNKSGTLKLYPVKDANGNVIKPFYYADVNGAKVYMMFAGNVGVAQILLGNETTYVVGLSKVASLNPEDFADKTYTLFTSIKEEGQTNPQWDIWKLEINGNGTWRRIDIDTGNVEGTGAWEVSGDHIVAKDDNGNSVANFVVKPGDFAVGIVVDFVDGSGFAIGLEQKPLTAERVSGTFHMFTHHLNHSDDDCFEEVVVSGTTDTMHDLWCANSDNYYSSGRETLALNKTCDGTSVNGIICVTTAENEKIEVFADAQDGYYFVTRDADDEEGLIYTVGSLATK